MPQVVLIRPGVTQFDEERRIQGRLDVPLNDQGAEQARQIARDVSGLGMTTLYCASCEAAIETGERIAELLDLKSRAVRKLHNLDQGLWQGLKVDEVKRKHPRIYRQWCESPLHVCPPRGEMLQEACRRVEQLIRPIIRRHRVEEVIGFVVPEPLARVVYSYLSREDLVKVWRTRSNEERWQLLEDSLRELCHDAEPWFS